MMNKLIELEESRFQIVDQCSFLLKPLELF